MKLRRKKLDGVKLESILKSIYFNEATWAERTECTRDEFLEIIYERLNTTLHKSINEMLIMSFHGKRFDEGINKSLDGWLDDDNVNVDVANGLKRSLSSLIGHYSNLASTIDMRLLVKDSNDADIVYLTYDPPPEFKGIAEVIYIFLNKDTYDSINEAISKASKVDVSDITGMYL